METQYRKKPAIFIAITFEQLVQHGIAQCINEGRDSSIINGRPWSFSYKGYPISHESDDCYVIPTRVGGSLMGPDDLLVIDEKGGIEVCKRGEFEAAHEPVGVVLAEQAGSATEVTNVESRLRCLEIACSVTPSSASDLLEDAEALLKWVYQDVKPGGFTQLLETAESLHNWTQQK